jgi:hypothetical protein
MMGRVVGIIRYIAPEDLFYESADGRVLVQKDYRVAGEVWQVHKSDADPFPSHPHAHSVGGRQKFIGLKLHLGTRQLWDGRRAMDLSIPKKPFARLIAMIQPKLPDTVLPIPGCQLVASSLR